MKPIFRNSMFGFQKSDVVRFIAKQSSMHETKVAELNEEIERIKKEHEAELEDLLQDRIALNKLQEDNLKKLDALLQLRRLTDDLKSDRDDLFSSLKEGKENVSKMSEEIRSLQSALETAQGYREKALKFDQLANVLNGIVNGGETSPREDCVEFERIALSLDLDAVNSHAEKQEETILSFGEKLDRMLQILESLAV